MSIPARYPTSETLWIFSGDSTASANNSIRTSSGSSNFDNQDTWDFATSNNSGNIYNANKPGGNGENISLSPLFSSSNNPKDTASVRARIPGGGRTDITFAANATNTPTITIGSRTIANLLLNDGPGGDEGGDPCFWKWQFFLFLRAVLGLGRRRFDQQTHRRLPCGKLQQGEIICHFCGGQHRIHTSCCQQPNHP